VPAGLIIEFEGVDQSHYDAVNEKLGLNAATGEGDWPDGLLQHSAGHTDDGKFAVVELWDTPEHQAAFMESRLGPALGEVGVPEPTRLTWIELVAQHNP
jgi:hypothetical protein